MGTIDKIAIIAIIAIFFDIFAIFDIFDVKKHIFDIFDAIFTMFWYFWCHFHYVLIFLLFFDEIFFDIFAIFDIFGPKWCHLKISKISKKDIFGIFRYFCFFDEKRRKNIENVKKRMIIVKMSILMEDFNIFNISCIFDITQLLWESQKKNIFRYFSIFSLFSISKMSLKGLYNKNSSLKPTL